MEMEKNDRVFSKLRKRKKLRESHAHMRYCVNNRVAFEAEEAEEVVRCRAF